MFELKQVPLTFSDAALPEAVERLIEEGLRRGKRVDCFDWVPSNYRVVYAALAELPAGRICEWGSGMGIVTGMAEILGHAACGLEIDPQLVDASRGLLAEFGLKATIELGSYFESNRLADVYFVYCWPGKVCETEERFLTVGPPSALLLICYGQEDIRGLRKIEVSNGHGEESH